MLTTRTDSSLPTTVAGAGRNPSPHPPLTASPVAGSLEAVDVELVPIEDTEGDACRDCGGDRWVRVGWGHDDRVVPCDACNPDGEGQPW